MPLSASSLAASKWRAIVVLWKILEAAVERERVARKAMLARKLGAGLRGVIEAEK